MGSGEANPAEGVPAGQVSRRVPWRAALLSVALAGLGQLYSGRLLGGVTLNAAEGVLLLICLLKLPFVLPQRWDIIAPLLIILLAWAFILGDSIYWAAKAPRDYRLKAYNRWYIYILLIALSGLEQNAFISFALPRFGAYKELTGSMSPTLLVGDRFLVDKQAYIAHRPQVGDVVVFRLPINPSELNVKRIVATGGDTLKVEDEKVFTNGQPLNEPYAEVPSEPEPLRDDFPPDPSVSAATLAAGPFKPTWVRDMPQFIRSDGLHVPQGDFFVMGDDRTESYDSRYWGFVPRADILGKARTIYFSWDAATRHIRWARIGEILR